MSSGYNAVERGLETNSILTKGLGVAVVTAKQRPPTVKGIAFYVLEDSPLRLHVVLSPDLWQKERDVSREARVLVVTGWMAREKGQSLDAKGRGGRRRPSTGRGCRV